MALEMAERPLITDLALRRLLGRLRASVFTTIAPLDVQVATSPEPITFAQRRALSYRRIRRGSSWGGAFTCAWFHVTGRLPQHPGKFALLLDTDGEALVRDDDGNILGAISSRSTPIEQLAPAKAKTRFDLPSTMSPGAAIDLWLEASYNGKWVQPFGRSVLGRMVVVEVNELAEKFYYDLLTTWAAMRCAPPEHADHYRAAMTAAQGCLNDYSDLELTAASHMLAPLLAGTPDASLHLSAIGHGHLDLAWLWPIRETKRKAARTLATQLGMLRRYPQARYGISQPQQLAWLQQSESELFTQVAQLLRAGRFEAQGGMWVEADTNLPSGESLVRQMLVGQTYWTKLLGHPVRTCWLPDAFGYSGALPQLIRKAGMDYFMTIKLAWNEVTPFPHRSFTWRGIDGSQVLVHMPPEGTYNSSATPQALLLASKHHDELSVGETGMLVYGSGDGGGGPGVVHHELLAREQNLEGFPCVEPGTAEAFFDALAKTQTSLPVWDGELYLQKHQGTYTTQAAVKAGNRRLEAQLHDVEYLASIAWLAGEDWPTAQLDDAWRTLLLHQFHDMLPGSSIARVHAETSAAHAQLAGQLGALQAELLAGDQTGKRFFVNTWSTARRGHVKLADTWFCYDVPAGASAELTPSQPVQGTLSETEMSNGKLSVRWRADGAAIESLTTTDGHEFCGDYLNELAIYQDPFSFFDAWDIRESAFKMPRAVLRPTDVETFRDGPHLVRRSRYVHAKTVIEQDAILADEAEHLLFETRVDWAETWKMLRADHRPSAWGPELTCDIQFGHIKRTTADTRPQDRAQFEVCAHQWVNLHDGSHGLSLLNDAKYGHHAKRGLLSLNLLRSPVYPDRSADRGHHEFSYALYPFSGPLATSRSIELATDLNAAPIIANHRVDAPVQVHGDGVRISAIKRAEDGQGLIVRLFETHGRPASVELTTQFDGQVSEVDLLERPTGAELDLSALQFGPFEVRTLRLKRFLATSG